MKCDKCHNDFNDRWESGKTYEGIDAHHNPPEFISDYLEEPWSGEFYNLCRKHHINLHKEILKILNNKSTSLKFIDSEYWICKRMTQEQIRECKEPIIIFTRKWIKKEDGDNDTSTI